MQVFLMFLSTLFNMIDEDYNKIDDDLTTSQITTNEVTDIKTSQTTRAKKLYRLGIFRTIILELYYQYTKLLLH